MNDYFQYFIGGFIVVIIIAFSRMRQNRRLKEFVKDADEVPQIFLEQAVERKLKVIYGKLYENGIKPTRVAGEQSDATATGLKQQLIQKLEQLEAAYTEKKIRLADYNDKLQQIQDKTADL
nr:hypothetical protein [uncultured Mucilaginibacter sp.]